MSQSSLTEAAHASSAAPVPWPEPVWVCGLPLAPLTHAQTIDRVRDLIRARKPSFFITANLNYAMLTAKEADLAAINDRAAFVLADGMPLVWAARRTNRPLPERVAGSDLIASLAALAASEDFSLFLLGGADGVGESAAEALKSSHPSIRIVGTHTPPVRPKPTPEDTRRMIDLIRAAAPDLLLVAFGQPKGERWIDEHIEALGVPLSVQVGASLDFVSGRIKRAPRWLQLIGLEWVYRLALEPKRLFTRYFTNGVYFLQTQWGGPKTWRPKTTAASPNHSNGESS